MELSEKVTGILNKVSLVAGIFTGMIAIMMIFSLIQIKTINPLDTPALQAIKAQFDSDPGNKDMAEQVRAIDLMSRKAYFTARWQVESGSYLLLAGALIFVICQRLIASNEKKHKNLLAKRPDISEERKKGYKYLIIAASVVVLLAIISSFIMRSELPTPGRESEKFTIISQKSGTGLIPPSEVNYPFFRGEGSRGIAAGSDYPTEWNAELGKNIKWKLTLPNPGKSSPVIWGDKIFMSGAGNGELSVYCVDKNSGELLWTGSGKDFEGASEEEPESDAEAGMAVPTPAVNENAVFVSFGNGNIVCFDHKGNLIWGKNIGIPENIYGFTSSLLIYDKILIVQYDSQSKMAISGYDTETGELKWETIRSGRLVNSSPVLTEFDGQVQVLVNGNPNVSSYNPINGEELWSLPGVSGDVASSVGVNSKLVFTATDYFNLLAIKPGKAGSTVWQDNAFTPDVASPVANEKYLFIATGNGDVACYNTEKGDTAWSHYFSEPFYASPVICDDKVWLMDRTGVMHIVEAGNLLKILGESPVGEAVDCTPAFSENKIYIRGKHSLYCIAK